MKHFLQTPNFLLRRPQPPERVLPEAVDVDAVAPSGTVSPQALPSSDVVKLGGFVYNIELHLPESRDPAVYDALFRSLKSHLLS